MNNDICNFHLKQMNNAGGRATQRRGSVLLPHAVSLNGIFSAEVTSQLDRLTLSCDRSEGWLKKMQNHTFFALPLLSF